VALRDILTCLTTHRSFFGGRHNTFAAFSENGLHFLWQTQHFGDLSDRGLGRFWTGANQSRHHAGQGPCREANLSLKRHFRLRRARWTNVHQRPWQKGASKIFEAEGVEQHRSPTLRPRRTVILRGLIVDLRHTPELPCGPAFIQGRPII
jgi:hypothetical protein